MNEEDEKRLSGIILRLNGLTGVLCGYCENFRDHSNEISDLSELAEILDKIANELYELL